MTELVFHFRMKCNHCGRNWIPKTKNGSCPYCHAPWWQTYAIFYNKTESLARGVPVWESLTKPLTKKIEGG